MSAQGIQTVTTCHGLNVSHGFWDCQLVSAANQLIKKSSSHLGTNRPQVSRKDAEHE